MNKIEVYRRGMTGKKHTVETKMKMRESALGRRHSEETKAKLSVVFKGRTPWSKGKKFSPEYRKKISDGHKNLSSSLKGRKLSFELRKKLSDAHKGYVPSLETRLKLRTVNSGEKHHAWKGGVSPLQLKIRRLPEYIAWRIACMKRDQYTCQFCLKRGGDLEVDHIHRFSEILRENLIKSVSDARNCCILWDILNGRTLCVKCHKTVTYGNRT